MHVHAVGDATGRLLPLGGGAGPSAKHLLFETIKRVSADAVGLAAESKAREFREVISMAIAREVARQLSLRCQILDT